MEMRGYSILLVCIIIISNPVINNQTEVFPQSELGMSDAQYQTHTSSVQYETVCDIPSRLQLQYNVSGGAFNGNLVHCGGVQIPQGYTVGVVIYLIDMTNGDFLQEQVIFPYNPIKTIPFSLILGSSSPYYGWEVGATPFYVSTHNNTSSALSDWGPMNGNQNSPSILGTRESLRTYASVGRPPGRYDCQPHNQTSPFVDSRIVVKSTNPLLTMPIVISSSKSWCNSLIIDRLTWIDYEFQSHPFTHSAAGIANNHHFEVETRLLTNDRTTPLSYDNVAGEVGYKLVLGVNPGTTQTNGFLLDGVDYQLPSTYYGDWLIIETRGRVISGLGTSMSPPHIVISSTDWRPVYTDGAYADYDKNGVLTPSPYYTLPVEAIGMTTGWVEFGQFSYSNLTPIPNVVIRQMPTIGTTHPQNSIRHNVMSPHSPTGFIEEQPHHPELNYMTGFTTIANTNQCPQYFSLVWELDSTLTYSINSVPGVIFSRTDNFNSQSHQTYTSFLPYSNNNYKVHMNLTEHEYWSSDTVSIYTIHDVEYDFAAGCIPTNLATPPGSTPYSVQIIQSNQHSTYLRIF